MVVLGHLVWDSLLVVAFPSDSGVCEARVVVWWDSSSEEVALGLLRVVLIVSRFLSPVF